jgi:hypothetical protein
MASPRKTKEPQTSQTETIKSFLDEIKEDPPECQVRRIRKILHSEYSGRAPKPTEFGPRMQLVYTLKDLPEKKYFPKWPNENKEIAERIQRGKFEDVYEYMFRNCIPLSESIAFSEKLRFGKYCKFQNIDELYYLYSSELIYTYEYVLFKPDYEKMSAKIGISVISCKKYLSKMYRAWIKPGGGKRVKSGSHKGYIYAIGFWRSFSDEDRDYSYRKISFMRKEPQIVENLKKFVVR